MKESTKKAKELIEKFGSTTDNLGDYNLGLKQTKECAIICVDNEIKTLNELKTKLQSENLLDSTFIVINLIDLKEEVRQEISNIEKEIK